MFQSISLSGSLKAPGSHHLDVGPGDGQDGGRPVRRGADHSERFCLLAQVDGAARGDDGVGGQEGSQVGLDSDGSHAGPSSTVRDAERLVEVEVRHVGAIVPGSAQTHLGVHVGPVQIDLPTRLVHQLAQRGDAGLEHAVSGRISYHDAGQSVLVSLHLGFDVLHVDRPVSGGLDGDHLHSSHLG